MGGETRSLPVAGDAPISSAVISPQEPDMRRQIKKVIEEMVNPAVASHGGEVHLVDFVNNNVYLRLAGGCQGCASSSATLKNGIERLLREEFPSIDQIIDVTDHESGENPYYS